MPPSKRWDPPLLLITWADANGETEWTTLEEFKVPDLMCLTVGWLVKEEETFISVCDSKSASLEDTTLGGVTTIPKPWVGGIEVLRGHYKKPPEEKFPGG